MPKTRRRKDSFPPSWARGICRDLGSSAGILLEHSAGARQAKTTDHRFGLYAHEAWHTGGSLQMMILTGPAALGRWAGDEIRGF